MKDFTGRVHELKTWPEPFTAIVEGRKSFEIRQDDRGFAVGDILCLKEWDPAPRPGENGKLVRAHFTGREVRVRVTYMIPGGAWGLPRGVCVMSIAPSARQVELSRLRRDKSVEQAGVVGMSSRFCDPDYRPAPWNGSGRDEDAKSMVLKFLKRVCDCSEPILADIYRCDDISPYGGRSEPFSLHEFGLSYDLEQVAQGLVEACRADIDCPDDIKAVPTSSESTVLYGIRLHGSSDRVQFRLTRRCDGGVGKIPA